MITVSDNLRKIGANTPGEHDAAGTSMPSPDGAESFGEYLHRAQKAPSQSESPTTAANHVQAAAQTQTAQGANQSAAADPPPAHPPGTSQDNGAAAPQTKKPTDAQRQSPAVAGCVGPSLVLPAAASATVTGVAPLAAEPSRTGDATRQEADASRAPEASRSLGACCSPVVAPPVVMAAAVNVANAAVSSTGTDSSDSQVQTAPVAPTVKSSVPLPPAAKAVDSNARASDSSGLSAAEVIGAAGEDISVPAAADAQGVAAPRKSAAADPKANLDAPSAQADSSGATSTAPVAPHREANPAAQSGSASPAQGTADLSSADRVRFVQRVEQAFQSISGGGSLRLRLSPPELGSLRLEINVRNGELTAKVETDNSAARSLLLDNLPALRDRLAQQDIKIQQFDVSLAGGSGGGARDWTARNSESFARAGSSLPAPSAPAESQAAPTLSDTTARYRLDAGGRLNVIV
ncbi:MAG: flagellar hook-length control protein FliK [Thermoguttaceae bacterium]|jgi:flagellar hook-length control protein FliK